MVDAIPALTKEENVKTFEKFNVFTRAELASRADVEFDQFSKAVNIEAKTMIDMAGKQFIPAAIKYQSEIAETVNSTKKAAPDLSCRAELDILKKVDSYVNETEGALNNLIAALDEAEKIDDHKEKAEFFHNTVTKRMKELRQPVDCLEMIVAKEDWPMPSYGDLLFEV